MDSDQGCPCDRLAKVVLRERAGRGRVRHVVSALKPALTNGPSRRACPHRVSPQFTWYVRDRRSGWRNAPIGGQIDLTGRPVSRIQLPNRSNSGSPADESLSADAIRSGAPVPRELWKNLATAADDKTTRKTIVVAQDAPAPPATAVWFFPDSHHIDNGQTSSDLHARRGQSRRRRHPTSGGIWAGSRLEGRSTGSRTHWPTHIRGVVVSAGRSAGSRSGRLSILCESGKFPLARMPRAGRRLGARQVGATPALLSRSPRPLRRLQSTLARDTSERPASIPRSHPRP